MGNRRTLTEQIQALVMWWTIAIFLGAMSIAPQTVHSQARRVSPNDMNALNEAFAEIDAKKYSNAEEKLHLISKSADPIVSKMAFEGLAHLFRLTNEYAKVVTAYDAAIAKGIASPSDLEAFHRLAGQAAVMAGDYGAAVKHLTLWKGYLSQIALSSRINSPTLAYLAVAQAEIHQFNEALATIDAALFSSELGHKGLTNIREVIKTASESPKDFAPGIIAAVLKNK